MRRTALRSARSTENFEWASPPGFPRNLLDEAWSARLAYFQRYTVAHPHLMDAKERLMAAVQNSEANALVFVFGPTGVGKTTLRLKTEQLLSVELSGAVGRGPRTAGRRQR